MVSGIFSQLLEDIDAAASEPTEDDWPDYVAPPSPMRLAPGPAPPATPIKVWTPATAVEFWRAEGKVSRLPTGFETFDAAMRGGFPFGYSAVIAGAPNAGKTALAVFLGFNAAAHENIQVGVLGVDEHPLDMTVRLAQMLGYSIDECEERDESVLNRIAFDVKELPIRMYDAEHTIETAGADLAEVAKKNGRRAMLIGDSLQTVRSFAARSAETPRATVDANVIAFRRLAADHRMVVLMTSEMPRSGYANQQAAASFNDMAAGKESGSTEYQARTQIVLRTVKDYPGVIHANVPKMKPGGECEFWLTLNKARHSLTERAAPDCETTQGKEAAKVATARRQVATDARILTAIVLRRPGIGERDLRAELKKSGHAWGVDRLAAAKLDLHDAGTLENRGTNPRNVAWHICSAPIEEASDDA